MKLLLAFFLCLIAAWAPAQEVILDQYNVAITIPSGEGWQRGSAQRMAEGEMILSASQPETRQVFAIAYLPNMPSADIGNPGIVSRVMETFASLGYKSNGPQVIDWKGAKWVQLFGKRDEASARDFIAVCRATMRGRDMYLLLTVGRGDEEKVKDRKFMEIMDSFRYMERTSTTFHVASHPLYFQRRLAMMICAGAVGTLVFAYLLVMTLVKRRRHR